jgi:hypothetical protein
METGKVCITPAIKGKVTSRLEDKTLVSRTFEAAQDHLHSCCMALLRIRSEASHLRDSKGNA